jgi:predicted RNA-binding protein YlqC (UPF0109 family)
MANLADSVNCYMKEAVERIIKSLVGEPDAVEVTENADGKNVRIEVRVADTDMGRIIGREGRTVKAVRSILFVAGQKHGKRFSLDLVED